MKIICIGMNYHEHIRELGSATPTVPIFFMKPDTALLRNNEPFYLPSFSDDVQYECELVVRINRVVKAIDEKFAHRCYDEIGLGIDFTARDLQTQYKNAGLPWEICKAFDHSAAVAPQFIPKGELPEVITFTMDLNGIRKQTGVTSDMIFGIDKVISYVSQFITLKIGDLIFTGTPVGVETLKIGDRITAKLEGRTLLDFEIK
ncbi:Fumarylacetoacetate hydrolase family protein [Mucinivorans hirudinis]|uniref:Fumarylacetoacetate hydrolase family protein n=1 Tax=Mucinivorans hirudinis TaxID=1433126 RepID=A0A060RE21_9BACT|nr:Fumarylacetoacetate hydrolase family protein [Mucinivorans hirudinis]